MSDEQVGRRLTAQGAGAWRRCALGLGLAPCAVAVAARVLPGMQVPALLGSSIAFAGATVFPILGLALATTAELSRGLTVLLATGAAVMLLALAFHQPAPSLTLLIVDGALVTLAWALGASLGRRVQHPAHLLPACVVAACADLVSLLSPEGPSHAIAESDRALSVLAVGFPVPGSHAVAPALGVGDLLFIALVLGVARAHRLPYARSVALCLLGTAFAGAGAASFGVAVPALVPIAGAIVLGLPSIRKLRKEDRPAARLSMVIAGSIAIAAIARGLVALR